MDAATIIKRIRVLSGVTRKELAELAGVAPSTIGRVEQGTLDPTWGTLSHILEATGHQINGDTVVSAGDPSGIAAARPVLEKHLALRSAAEGSPTAPCAAAANSQITEAVSRWLGRWGRVGWLSDRTDVDDLVCVAVSAGNAGKIARRSVLQRTVVADGGWRSLARRLDEAGFAYAISGLVATRRDRASATAVRPVIYVDSPPLAVAKLDLEETGSGRGVLLISPVGDELERTETEGGIRFVSRAQGVLDAFAGAGREPDKAEDALRSLLSVTA
ncbi:helix-turn-helix domain-containing protein [Brevibacterium yomogidense]|uniref:helix-turn-helix domain-containing protein n=1 Tax=Brevibacterium yomogidense TaxID=946573 RepID=UPI0018DFF7ED